MSDEAMNKFEWVTTHRHLQRIGTAFSSLSNLLLEADMRRCSGDIEGASMLASAARTMIRQRVSMQLLNASKINRPKRKVRRS